jgi:hypothetical protein
MNVAIRRLLLQGSMTGTTSTTAMVCVFTWWRSWSFLATRWHAGSLRCRREGNYLWLGRTKGPKDHIAGRFVCCETAHGGFLSIMCKALLFSVWTNRQHSYGGFCHVCWSEKESDLIQRKELRITTPHWGFAMDLLSGWWTILQLQGCDERLLTLYPIKPKTVAIEVLHLP